MDRHVRGTGRGTKACQKESAALAEKANKGELKGLCQEMARPFTGGKHR